MQPEAGAGSILAPSTGREVMATVPPAAIDFRKSLRSIDLDDFDIQNLHDRGYDLERGLVAARGEAAARNS